MSRKLASKMLNQQHRHSTGVCDSGLKRASIEQGSLAHGMWEVMSMRYGSHDALGTTTENSHGVSVALLKG